MGTKVQPSRDRKTMQALELIEIFEQQGGSAPLVKAIIEILGSGSSNPEVFLGRLLNKLHAALESDVSFVGLVTEEHGQARLVVRDKNNHVVGAELGMTDAYLFNVPVGGIGLIPENRTMTGYVASIGQSIRTGNVTQWKEENGGCYRASLLDVKSELAVPVKFEESEVLAVMNFESRERDKFSDADQKLVEWVARVISGPLEAMMNRAGFRKPYLATLDKVNEELGTLRLHANIENPLYLSSDSRAVLDRVCRLVAKALRSSVCRLIVLAKDKRLLEMGEHIEEDAPINLVEEARELAREAIKAGWTLSYDLETEYGSKPTLVVPILSRGEPYGALMVACPKRTEGTVYYSAGDERLLHVLQQLVATRLDMLRQEWARRSAADERRASVASLLEAFGDMNFETILNSTILKIMEVCAVLHCSIFLLDELTGDLVRVSSSPLPRSLESRRTYVPGEGLTGWVFSRGKSLILSTRTYEDLAQVTPPLIWRDEKKDLDPALRDRPFMAVPILLGSKAIGVIRCTDKREGPFSEADEQFVSSLASHISQIVAIDKRHAIGHSVQRHFLAMLSQLSTARRLTDIGAFEQCLYQEVLRSAHEVFEPDLTLLFKCTARQLVRPPVWLGQLFHPKYIGGILCRDSVVYDLIYGDNTTVWFDDCVGDARLTEGKLDQGNIADTGRFVIREQIRSSVGLRLGIGAGVLFVNYRRARQFRSDFVQGMNAFQKLTSLCFELVEAYKRSSAAASDVHHTLVPSLQFEIRERAAAGRRRLQDSRYLEVAQDLSDIQGASKNVITGVYRMLQRLLPAPPIGPET
jgi:GAF domain-containing protein